MRMRKKIANNWKMLVSAVCSCSWYSQTYTHIAHTHRDGLLASIWSSRSQKQITVIILTWNVFCEFVSVEGKNHIIKKTSFAIDSCSTLCARHVFSVNIRVKKNIWWLRAIYFIEFYWNPIPWKVDSIFHPIIGCEIELTAAEFNELNVCAFPGTFELRTFNFGQVKMRW